MLGCTGFSQGFSELGLNLKSLLLGLCKPWLALLGSIGSLHDRTCWASVSRGCPLYMQPKWRVGADIFALKSCTQHVPRTAGGHGELARVRQNGQATRGIMLVACCMPPTDDTMDYSI
jgi:hypothetical protein